MPTNSTFNVIYLGQLTVIDPQEGNGTAESASQIIGTYDNFTPDSVEQFSPISYSSSDGSSSQSSTRFQTYNQNNSFGNDTFRITDSAGGQTAHTFDATVLYNATITYANGTTANVQLIIVQDTDGNTWVAPPSSYSASAAALDNQPIQSISLNQVAPVSPSLPNGGATFAGLFYNREVIDIETVVCFAQDTLIETNGGMIPVQDLQVGDLVRTRDNGHQPIRWIGSRHFSSDALAAQPKLRPIRIAAGALGKNTPANDLLVSPQHRVLVRSRIAQRMFGTDEVLVGAKQLLMIDGVDIDQASEGVTYYHFMTDQHDVVYSNGAETETLYAGAEALKSISQNAREELFTIFPELHSDDAPAPARLLASGRKGRKLVMRHLQNQIILQHS